MIKYINFPKYGFRIEIQLHKDYDWGIAFALNFWKPGICIGLGQWLVYAQVRGGSNE